MKKLLLLFGCAVLFMLTSCEGTQPQKKESPAPDIIGAVTLVPSSFNVLYGDDVTFTVMCEGQDVTQWSKIYYMLDIDKPKAFANATFTVKSKQPLVFNASFNGQQSDDIEVVGMGVIPEVVADPQPEKFDNFSKKVLMLQATGTWCGYCHNIIKPLDEFMESSSPLVENVVLGVAHTGNDAMSNIYSEAVVEFMEAPGYPYLSFDNAVTTALPDRGYENVLGKIKSRVENCLQVEPVTAISANSIVTDNIVSVRADVKVAKDGHYQIGMFITKDGIVADQINMGEIAHNHVIVGSYSRRETVVDLDNRTSHKAGETYSFFHELEIEEMRVLKGDTEGCKLVVFTYNTETELFDNAIITPLSTEAEFVYNN